MDPREFAAAQNRETRKITATVRRAVAQNGAPVTEAQREAMAKQLLPKVKRARVRVRDLGVEFMETQAAAADVELAPQPIRDYESRAIVKVLERVTGAPDEKSSDRRRVSVVMADPKTRSDVRKRVTVTDENRHDPVVKKAVGERAAASVERHVRNAAREAVSDAAEVAGTEVGWARVLSGAESCPWCAMLASRGPAYQSEASAGSVTERSGRFDAGEAKAYHDNCDCIVVPVFEDVPWYGQEHYELLEDLWIESTRGLSAPDSEKAFAAALKKTHLTKLPDNDTDTGNDGATELNLDSDHGSGETFDPNPDDSVDEASSYSAIHEEEGHETRPISPATRDLIEHARASVPVGEPAWDATPTLNRDVNHEHVPSAELLGHLDTVTSVGRAINADVTRRIDADTAITDLRASAVDVQGEVDAAKDVGNFLEMLRARDRLASIQSDISARESAFVREALADVRDFGGHEQAVRTLTDSDRADLSARAGRRVEEIDGAAVEMLRYAEQYYPTEWLQAADARGGLGLGYVDRGFFLQKDPSTLPTDTITISRSGSTAVAYIGGAHSDAAEETMIHELGHRMEQAVPGLTQLEFALARSRATRNGRLEDLVEINGQGSGEVSYKDKWLDPYAGRSYVPGGYSRPDLVAHEVFQVGTQDLFGRSQRRYGDEQLQEFMMGVLALL